MTLTYKNSRQIIGTIRVAITRPIMRIIIGNPFCEEYAVLYLIVDCWYHRLLITLPCSPGRAMIFIEEA